MATQTLNDVMEEMGIDPDAPVDLKIYEVSVTTTNPGEVRAWIEANIDLHFVETVHAYAVSGTNPVEYQMSIFLSDERAATLTKVMWSNAKSV
ncbi:MAG: hypothetical protein EOP83_06185 [Verrucomicrobiaceae bacterium]|nr:MAG: hypothetical protein EOP83_06185 [Verrucomicrobiaceae bacterium]